jgi:hypothetical protein
MLSNDTPDLYREVRRKPEVGADTFDGFGVGRFRRVVGELAEFVAAGGELVELDGRVADAVAAGSLVEGPFSNALR